MNRKTLLRLNGFVMMAHLSADVFNRNFRFELLTRAHVTLLPPSTQRICYQSRSQRPLRFFRTFGVAKWRRRLGSPVKRQSKANCSNKILGSLSMFYGKSDAIENRCARGT